jgi:hypothetical protein
MKVAPLGDLSQGSPTAPAEREATEARLRDRVDALGIVIAGAAHEFNNVVMAVQAGVRMARKRADRPGEVERITGMVEAAAERGAQLTASLLAFARRDEAATHAFEICGSLNAVAGLLERTLGLAVEIDCPAGLAAVRGDQGEFETALLHLLVGLRKPTTREGALRIEVAGVSSAPGDPAFGSSPGRTGLRLIAAVGPSDAATDSNVGRLPKDPEASASAARAFAERNGGAAQVESAIPGTTTVTLWLATGEKASLIPEGSAE